MIFNHSEIKLEINHRKITEKFPNPCELNNTLLSNPQVKEEVTRELKIYIELNESENTIYQSWMDTVKVVLKGKLKAIYVCVRIGKQSEFK